jgi:hypothetical protein
MGSLFALLIAVALAVKYFWIVAAVIALAVFVHRVLRADARRRDEAVEPADQQRAYAIVGDPRATFGGGAAHRTLEHAISLGGSRVATR